MMQMRFAVAPISCPPHPKGKGRLRDSSFNTCSAFVAGFEGFCLLALPGCLHCQVLGLRMQGQLTWTGFAAGTACPDLTGGTALFGKQYLNGQFATRPLGRFPILALLPHGTCRAFVVPVNRKATAIVRLRIVRLPALILTQRPDEINLIDVLTADELFPRGV